VLHQVDRTLTAQNKTVFLFLFENSAELSRKPVIQFVKALIRSKDEIWLLIDETQNNVEAALFAVLLKNTKGHNITTIGAGVPEYQSPSSRFKRKIGTDRLFLNSYQMLVDEGVVKYFESIAANTDTHEIDLLLEHIRNYVGGHIYPLMWLGEQLVPRITYQSDSSDQVINYLGSRLFRTQENF
jgi:hypothetical protein